MAKKLLSMLLVLVLVLVLSMVPVVHAAGTTVQISSAAELPTEIAEGMVYELTADITLTSGQQISKLAGVLDGKGHTITLADKPLAAEVSGTIQNLGVLSSGTLSLSGYSGSMAVSLSGTIQNCYSLANLTTSGWDDIGGLVGTLSGGKIYNSYYAGSNSAMFADGLVGMGGDNSQIANSLYTAGYSAIGMNSSKVSQTNVAKKTAATMKETDAVTALNTDIQDTGFQWAADTAGINNGFPVLKAASGSDPVDKTALAAKIAEVEALDESLYTETTWTAVETALTAAKAANEKEAATQIQVNTALSDLEKAVNALEKKKPLVPVAPPADAASVVHITSETDLAAITASDATKYYVLDNDITLTGGYSGWWSFDTFQGVLDGQGHTVTFNGTKSGLFYAIGKNGVVQNVHFTGSLDADHGACGQEVQGAVINCYTEVTGSNASGFAKRLNGGVLSNCYSISPAEDGVIIEQTTTASGAVYTGTLHNVYWDNALAQPVSLSALTVSGSTGALGMKTMKSLDFAAALNENRGTYGTKWGQSSTGYPYFGENQEYDPDPDIVLPEDGTKLTFRAYNASEGTAVEDQQITLDVNAVDGFGVAGVFSLPEYTVPEGASVEWSCSQQEPAGTAAVNLSTGELFLYKEGILIVTATLIKADGSTEVLASVKVTSVSYEVEDIKLYLTDQQGDTENATEVVNGAVTVQGSGDQWIMVKARYAGETIYREVSIKSFSFAFAENEIVHHLADASVFYFEAPGTAALTVTYNANTAISETVQITSAYVPVTSVKPAASGTYTVHGRNANSDGSGEFLDLMLSHGVGNVIVEPANASYADDWTLTSSDAETAGYVDAFLKAVLPKKAGTVTLTATIIDKGPDGTGNTPVTGSSTITVEYFNPVTSVTVDTSTALTVKENEKIDLPISFAGPESANGYHVTEAGMTWSFAGEGQVEITRNGNDGVLIYGENSKEYCVSNDAYQITGVKAGTVTVTGTPIDTTGGAAPVTFTVTVESGTPETPADNDKIIKEGIASATEYLQNAYKNWQYRYGDEWTVFILTRTGQELTAQEIDHYMDTVAKAYASPTAEELKPTTIARVILAVSAVGKDPADVKGIDLLKLLCTSESMTAGSNEAIWALIALDCKDYAVPAGTKWTREALIGEILKYQNAETGAFGLTDNRTPSIDMTAMAIQALAPYYDTSAEAKASVDKAIVWLQQQMDRNCDLGSSESDAQVVIALSALGVDVLDENSGFVKSPARNMITAIEAYACDDGGYKHLLTDERSNGMGTLQALMAYEAYGRFARGESPLYDLTEKTDNNNSGSAGSTNTPSTPNTGDSFQPALMVLLMTLSLTCLAALTLPRKKRG